MDFAFDKKIENLQRRLQAFMDEYIYPNEQRFHDEIERNRWSPTAVIEELKPKARAAGLWNLFLPEDAGSPKSMTLKFKGVTAGSAKVTIVDKDHGSPLPEFERLGSPVSPTVAQIASLRKAAAMPSAKTYALKNGSLSLTLAPHALALIEVAK